MTGFNPKDARHMIPGGNAGGPAIQTKGVMGCFVVERREIPQMMYASDGGDFTAAQIRIGVGLWMRAFGAPKAPQQRCATCEHVFLSATDPEAFFLAIPFKGDGDSVVSGVCRVCVRKAGSDGLLGKAVEFFRRLWPDSKVTGGGMDNR